LNVFGQLGDGTTQLRDSPVAVSGGHRFTQISSGASLTCGLEAGGTGFCWGGSPTPVAVPIDSALASISAGRFHACAVTVTGEGFCWGDNTFGELGDSTTTSRVLPAPVAGGHRWQVIRAGVQNTCGIDSAGTGWCWGTDLGLGNGARPDAFAPDSIALPDTLLEVAPSVSLAQGCAVTRGQAGYCWGIGSQGQLGDGGIGTVALAPVGVTGANSFLSIEIGNTHACGLIATGGAVCWGGNASGELGDGGRVNRPAPGPVTGGITFRQVVAGTYHACGLDASGTAYCWGSNLYGELGMGVSGESSTPLLIP
jgi:alpha-tubulin suppressor-like RCC1 family protein